MKSLEVLSKTVQNHKNNELLNFDPLRLIPGQLIIIASRPGMGKTGFLLFMLQTIMQQTKKGLLFVSNEENENTLFKKFVCQVSSIVFEKLDSSINGIFESHSELSNENIFISYITCSWEKQKQSIINAIKENNIVCIFIDKIQGLYCERIFENREQELEFILHEIKTIAVKYNLVIIVSSALNRCVEKREGKIPVLSDLRSSEAIEEVSDTILFLHRPEYYGITEDDAGNSLAGIAEIIVAKNRVGPTGNFFLHFNKDVPQFKF